MIGFCWGVFPIFKASASGKVHVAVDFHPSLQVTSQTPEELAEAVKCPHLIVPGGNDPDFIKEGGSVEKVLKSKPFGDKVVVKTFKDMKHGWVNRGDLSDPTTARDVKAAMELAVDYFNKNL